MIRHFIPFTVVLWVAAIPLAAQEAPLVKAEIRMLAFTPDLKQKEVYAQDPAAAATAASVRAPVKSYLNHEFSTVMLKGRKIVFTTKPDRASLTRDGECIGEATLPDGANSVILMFLPGKPGAKARCQVMAIPDSKRAFPAGSYHATNLSPLPVRVMLEQKVYDFKPGQVSLIENPPTGEGQQSAMRTFVFKDDAWKQVAAGFWPHPGDARGLLVLFQNSASGAVQLRGFDDIAPRAPLPEQAQVN
ncbi:MAG: hypothetical protein RLZZ214_1903 [Verrucomicrobiota bacterium]|jgi:hypothetical protein